VWVGGLKADKEGGKPLRTLYIRRRVSGTGAKRGSETHGQKNAVEPGNAALGLAAGGEEKRGLIGQRREYRKKWSKQASGPLTSKGRGKT